MMYVVMIGDGYEKDLMGIFSTEEKANEYINSTLAGEGWIEEWELNKGEEL